MDWTETKSTIRDLFTQRYNYIMDDDRYVFTSNKGECFTVDSMKGKTEDDNCVLINYLEDGEDGDRFFPSDYDDLNKLVDDMIKEIEAV